MFVFPTDQIWEPRACGWSTPDHHRPLSHSRDILSLPCSRSTSVDALSCISPSGPPVFTLSHKSLLMGPVDPSSQDPGLWARSMTPGCWMSPGIPSPNNHSFLPTPNEHVISQEGGRLYKVTICHEGCAQTRPPEGSQNLNVTCRRLW